MTLARSQEEKDNSIRTNARRTRELLLTKGLSIEQAERLSGVRIFGEPPGAYGNGLETVIGKSDSWSNEKQVADVLFNRIGFLYGQGFWGAGGAGGGTEEARGLGQLLFKRALSGTKITILGRSSNLIGSLDNDDVYQNLGGLAMAVRSVDGATPEITVTNLANPREPKQESIDKYMGRELRARYLNPAWIQAMMKEGYAGARFVDKVVENLWGWQVTAPEAVDAAKWNEMYETYVLDRNHLDLREAFKKANNTWAYQSMVARMLETTRKGYWKPGKEVVARLAREYAETAREVGLGCSDHVCNNPKLTKLTADTLAASPGFEALERDFMRALEVIKQPQAAPAADAPATRASAERAGGSAALAPVAAAASRSPGEAGSAEKPKAVEGFEMKEVLASAAGSPGRSRPWLFIAAFLGFVGVVAFGFGRGKRSTSSVQKENGGSLP